MPSLLRSSVTQPTEPLRLYASVSLELVVEAASEAPVPEAAPGAAQVPDIPFHRRHPLMYPSDCTVKLTLTPLTGLPAASTAWTVYGISYCVEFSAEIVFPVPSDRDTVAPPTVREVEPVTDVPGTLAPITTPFEALVVVLAVY